jgi:hypothetical protein
MIILNIDNDGNGTVDDMLFFEPQYQNGTYSTVSGVTVPNQCGSASSSSSIRSSAASAASASSAATGGHCVFTDTWQTWNARLGGWWSLNESLSGPPLTSLDAYGAHHPNATIVNATSGLGGVRVAIGGTTNQWTNFSGNVDNLVISYANRALTSYDFEPDSAVASSSSAASAAAAVTTTATTTTTTTTVGGGGGRRISTLPLPAFGGGTSVPGTSSSSANSRPFPDVPVSSYYYDAIRSFLDKGFLDASQLTFRPSDDALRSELAKLIVVVNGGLLNAMPSTASFDDVAVGAWYYAYFEDAGARGWIKGDGNCYGMHPCIARPGATINRAEAAAMIVRAFGYEATNDATGFSDVRASAWFAPVIQTAADHCILQGDQGTTLVRPAAFVNRAELITMLYRAYQNLSYAGGCQPMINSSSSAQGFSSSMHSFFHSSSSSNPYGQSSSASSRSATGFMYPTWYNASSASSAGFNSSNSSFSSNSSMRSSSSAGFSSSSSSF